MSDGTEGLGADANATTPQAPEGTHGGEGGEGYAPDAQAFDISKFPENEQEILRSLPEEYQATVGTRFRDSMRGAQSIATKANQQIAAAKAVQDQAEWAKNVQENPMLMSRLMGLDPSAANGASAPAADPYADLPDPSELDLSNKEAFYGTIGKAIEQTVGPGMEARFKKMLESSEPIKERRLDNAAAQFWNGVQGRGINVTPEQKTQAVRLFASSVEDWRGTDPKDLPKYLNIALQAVTQNPQNVAPATSPGTGTTSVPATGGATVPTRRPMPWEREKRKPTDTEIFDLAGGVSGRDFEKMWERDRHKAM